MIGGKNKKSRNVFYLPAARTDIDCHRAFAENLYPVREGESIVVMLSAGKIGSQSVIQSLKKSSPEIFSSPSYHLHMFSDASKQFEYKLGNEPRFNLDQIISGHALRCFWDKNRKLFKWKFISGVREPISQLLSLHYMILPESKIENTDEFINEVSIRWPYVSNHFDDIYREIIGIDVFDYPFDKQKGYSIIRKGNVEILLYTLENLNDIAEVAFSEFLGLTNFQLIRANEAKNLPYKERYQEAIFRLEKAFNGKELEEFYSHKVTTHFYPEEKINDFRRRWISPSALNSARDQELPLNPWESSFLKNPNCLTYARKSHWQYFEDLDLGLFGYRKNMDAADLKTYQDLLVMRFIQDFVPPGSRILDVGGGNSRILRHFHETYECWNLDKLEGIGNGPKDLKSIPYKLVRDYLGEFSTDLPENYFDLVFSISALEHVPENDYKMHDRMIDDITRILKPGGYSFHLLDIVFRFNGEIWMNGIGPRMFERVETINSYFPPQDVSGNPDLYFMSKTAYENIWSRKVTKSYKEFGRPSSLNILWQKPVS